MNSTLKYGEDLVSGFNELLDKYPSNQFNSPRRSTVPLLAYWKEKGKCEEFLFHLDAPDGSGIPLPAALTLSFEYEVPVQKGKGAPSCTDLMMVGDTALQCTCLVVPMEKKAAFLALEERWVKEKERCLRDEVREGLREDRFFEFSEPVICSVGEEMPE